ncbi:MAG: hypothetical protein MZW92_66000 [Comamonadaceae bacterium]|nr:hypothetical protein [Comamonadaceae bacterium]
MRLPTELVARWWPHGHFDVEACRSVYRWSKYMAKSESKQKVPPSLRLFGSGGLDQAGSDAVQLAIAPTWLRRVLPVFARPRRCKRGGGWVDVLTGEIYRSPYVWSARGVRRRELTFSGV